MTTRTAPALLVLLAACSGSKAATPPTETIETRVGRIVGGLRPNFAIKGEPAKRWTLAERMEHYHVPGVSIAVIDSGRIVWAKGFGVKEAGGTDSVTTTTLFQAGSISKPTFAVGLMRLVQDGKLNLDEDVNLKLTSWKVPENKFTTTEKVTLRRILSHNAGLTVHGFPGYAPGTPVPTVPQLLDGTKPANTAAVRVDTFPGAISRYSGGGTTVAQLLVTDVSKKPFPEFMKETVLWPAGMTHSTYEQPLPPATAPNAATGHRGDGKIVPGKFHTYPEMAAAGLWTTPSDLATLAIELQRTHAGQSSKVIDKATFDQMLTTQKEDFGIGYAVDGAGSDREFSHNGADEGFIAHFNAFAERGQGLVIMTNGDRGGNIIGEIVPAVAEEFGWPSHRQREKTVVARDPSTFSELTGDYSVRVGGPKPTTMTVSVENGKLFFDTHTSFFGKQELVPDSDSTFFARDAGFPARFDRAGGKVVAIRLFGSLEGKKIK